MFPGIIFWCHLALDVEKLCSVLGKLLVSPDLSSKCSDARSPGKLESTGKSEPILTFVQSRFAAKIRQFGIYFRGLHHWNNKPQFLVQFLISEKPSISRNQGVSHLMLFVVNCTILMLLIGLNSNAILTYSYSHKTSSCTVPVVKQIKNR